jgi:hypothetical protein
MKVRFIFSMLFFALSSAILYGQTATVRIKPKMLKSKNIDK